jgi:anti-sigma factor RsiW
MTGTLREEDLHAFIDGELDDARAREVARMIASDRALADTVQAYRVDKARLLEHYEPVLDQPIPAAWLERIEQARKPRRMVVWRRPVYALAASLLALILGWSGYQVLLERSGEAVVDEAVSARDVAVDGGAAFDAAQVAQVLGTRVKLPDLSRAGYAFAGAAVISKTGGKAVKLDYRDHDNRVFTLYLKASSGRTHFEMSSRGPVRICLWQDDVLASVMVGEMSSAEMLRVASLAYNGLYF